MLLLVIGLVLFLGIHSIRIVAEPWRQRQIARLGLLTWKGLFALVAAIGLVLIVIGYGQARLAPVWLWFPPLGMRHLASLLTLVAFVLVAAAYVPRNAIRAKLRHPMILGVKAWALAHLLANGALADVVLFGAFLVWAIVDFRSARRRVPQPVIAPGTLAGTAATVLVGVLAWAAFAFYLHQLLIGVRPF